MKRFTEFLIEEEERINPTTYNLPALYDGLNAMLFNRELPELRPVFGKPPKGASGVTTYTVMQNPHTRSRTTKPETIAMIIKAVPYRTDVFYGIVAHEMVHVWCAFTNHHENDTHGIWFQGKRAQIQPKASFQIPPKDVQLDDEERGAQPSRLVSFIAAGKPDNTEIVSLFQQRAFDDAMQRTIADAQCKSLVQRDKFSWAIYGKAETGLASSLTVQRAIKNRASENKFYKANVRLLTKMQVMGSEGQR